MRKASIFRMAAIVVVGVVTPHFAQADVSMDRLMSSYVIAKTEIAQVPMNDSDMKAYPYTIQVASYINEKDAASHVEELKGQEKEAKYYPMFVRGQVWFKVCVGRFTTKEEAETYKKGFVKRTDEPFAVVISWLDRAKTAETSHDGGASATANEAEKTEKVGKAEKKRKPASALVAANDSMTDELKPLGAFEKAPAGKAKKEIVAPEAKPTPEVKAVKAKAVMKPEVEAATQHALTHEVAAVAKPQVKVNLKPAAVTISGESYYSLQVGAYPSEKLAKESGVKFSDKFGDKEAAVSYHEATVNGQVWHRVYVGKFKNKKDAEEYQKKLSGHESLIRKITQ